jgi:hypothetical protein
MKYLPLLSVSIFMSSCAPVQEKTEQDVERTPEQQLEFVEKAYRAFYDGVRSEDEATRLAAIDEMLPKKPDIVTLLGEEKAAKVWEMINQQLSGMREHNAEVKKEFDQRGDLTAITVKSARDDEHFADGLSIVSAEIPVFHIVDKTATGGGGSSCYVILEERVVFVRELEEIKDYLERLKPDDE